MPKYTVWTEACVLRAYAVNADSQEAARNLVLSCEIEPIYSTEIAETFAAAEPAQKRKFWACDSQFYIKKLEEYW